MSIKQKIIIYITIVLLIIGAVVYTIILPTIKDIKKINDAVLAERIDLEKKYLKGQLLKQTVENFEKIKPHEDKLAKIYISKDGELEFVTKLESIANKNDITQSIELSTPTVGTAEYEPLSLAITSSGEFLHLLQYLRDIEQLNNYFNISKIAVTAGNKDQQGSNAITIQITGQAFKLLKTDEISEPKKSE